MATCYQNHHQKIRMSKSTPLVFGVALAMLVGLTGCSKSGTGRFDLSGQITYEGKVVPAGYLRFVPDKKNGNRGPGSSATILEGKYETMPDMGTVGGPHLVFIVGTDGVPYTNSNGVSVPIGRRLFPEYEVSIDLPKESTTYDFEVPLAEPTGKKKSKR